MKTIVLLLMLLCSLATFAKFETDTITNWQIYLDKELILKSNISENGKTIGYLKLNDNFKTININIFNCATNNIKTGKIIQIIVDGKIIKRFYDYNSNRNTFAIKKEEIFRLLKKCFTKEITFKYIDEKNLKGYVLGKLKIKYSQ